MSVRVAIVGCAHGELDEIYRNIQDSGNSVDILLCCGDFQAVRNRSDLHHLHCPEHYRDIRTFHKYYSGEAIAPVLTIFIGGNHESTAFSQELPHGGWVAPNIYYLGFANVIRFGGLRIGGWSGIYKQNDYGYNHFEAPPFPRGQHVSAYHVRAIEHFRLQLLKQEGSALDIFLTHDWPNGITQFGDKEKLLRFKPYFRPDIERNQLGNSYSMDLIRKLKPKYHFAAHMHAFFDATVPHTDGIETRFTALSKCAQKIRTSNYLTFFEINSSENSEKVLSYDSEWLAILKNTSTLEQSKKAFSNIPNKTAISAVTQEQKDLIIQRFGGDMRIPFNFKMTAPPESALQGHIHAAQAALYFRNPQTREFCEKLDIPDWNEIMCRQHEEAVGIPYYAHLTTETESQRCDEISLDDNDLFGDDDLIEDATPQIRSKRGIENDHADVDIKKQKA